MKKSRISVRFGIFAAITAVIACSSSVTSAGGGLGQQRSSQRSPSKTAAAVPDYGIDVALVTAQKAGLRQEPGPTGAVLVSVKKGELLALVDRQKTANFYNVIHVESGKEGWINSSYVKLFYTKKKKEAALFQEEKKETQEDPDIVISNQSNKTMRLKVADVVHVFSPNTQKTITMAPGNHSYYASAPGVLPAFGKKDFQAGSRYTWTFYIRTTVVPSSAGRVRLRRR